mmetsp:Transcript_4677/g.7769  ORF Transcript_4677/g.7769 Transcript_4677/m.7769 type:complete len:233 (-) Transcript_4677:321-1019(-)
MKFNVIIHEAVDEKVAMVISLLEAEGEGLARGPGGRLQGLRLQLVHLAFIEVVISALVNQNIREGERSFGLHQFSGIVILPLLDVGAQVAPEGLVAPGAVGGVADGGERGHALVRARVFERDGERPVAPHGVAEHPAALAAGAREALSHQLHQLLGNVGVHLVVGGPGRLRGVHVKARARAEVPALVLALHAGAARAGVGADQRQPGPGRRPEGAALLHHILICACQAREVI